MIKNLLNRFKNKSITIKILLIFSMATTALLFLVVNSNKDPKLIINSIPEDSNISISGEGQFYNETGKFEKRVAKGIYKIKIEKDEHITEEREVVLSKDTELTISLIKSSTLDIQKSYQSKKISPIFSKEGFSQGNIYGIDKRNGNLISFENGNEKVIYSGSVKDYDIGTNKAVILDSDRLSEVVVVDLNTLKQSKINLEKYSPIISVSISIDESTVFFLAEFSITDKISSLNQMSINGSSISNITETKSQSIKYLKNQNILLFEENHDEDKNTVNIYNIGNKTILKTIKTSTYSISPETTKILLQRSNAVEILDLDSLKSNIGNIQTGSRSAWKDDSTVINFRNTGGNVLFTVVYTNPFKIVSQQTLLENTSLLNVFGFIGEDLYLQDYNENIFSLDFSSAIVK